MGDQLVSVLFGIFISGAVTFTITVIRWGIYARQRRQLLHLFGIKPANSQIVAYLSRLQILPGGTIAVGDETIRRGYKGPAINYVEYEGALKLRELLQGNLLVLPPEWFTKTLLGNRAYHFLPVEL
ncbi:MAG TPA: hypothetical protein VHL11_22835, partial [Phototrophicaceae bacterium]|nr:hypothetical protein [Phototrophicaceae bacterium]